MTPHSSLSVIGRAGTNVLCHFLNYIVHALCLAALPFSNFLRIHQICIPTPPFHRPHSAFDSCESCAFIFERCKKKNGPKEKGITGVLLLSPFTVHRTHCRDDVRRRRQRRRRRGRRQWRVNRTMAHASLWMLIQTISHASCAVSDYITAPPESCWISITSGIAFYLQTIATRICTLSSADARKNGQHKSHCQN